MDKITWSMLGLAFSMIFFSCYVSVKDRCENISKYQNDSRVRLTVQELSFFEKYCK
jgi:hypothetical protein